MIGPPLERHFVADRLTPVAVYRRLRRLSPIRFLFESVTGGEQVSRFSFLAAGPSELYRVDGEGVEVERDGARHRLPGPPLATLAALAAPGTAASTSLPFSGGLVGYFGFDLVRLVERLPQRPPDRDGLPLAVLGRFDELIVFDHARQRIVAVAREREDGRRAASERLERLAALVTAAGEGGAIACPPVPPPAAPGDPSLDGPAFRRAVRQAQEEIFAGEVFQVVLARRFRIGAPRASPLALYRALRLINPSPYMVLLETPEVALVGASPEMLVRKTGSRLETRPIAGTRPRGAGRAEDERLAAELASDPKELAEHLMLVDLGRNDLGRVAAPGTVEVGGFREIERYSHVMHLVTEVTAELAPGRSALDALLACFPAGTVTGAPKVRALELIDQLEPEARGPYAGAVGYLSYDGDLDTCITIRTLMLRGDELSVTAGAGIVADSDPGREELETESKAAGMLAAAALAESLAAGEDEA